MLFDSMGGGTVFRPDELKLLQSAFDDAVLAMALYLRPDQLDSRETKRLVAEAIRKAATNGCRDREALRNFGLAQLEPRQGKWLTCAPYGDKTLHPRMRG
jgi:hypothetical protein